MTIPADQVSYADLYKRWEQSNWRATELDLTIDREQWQTAFTEFDRRAALWTYSMFFHGEDSVADNLSPFIDAAPTQEQKYFLATQQVDEARHAVLFGRFMHEVAGQGVDVTSALRATRPELTWGFRKTFELLDRTADELRHDRSRPKLAQAITLYHLVIEAALAQPGQHFIDEGLSRRDALPGFREGIRNVSRDEQRHIAFGVKMIADLVREDPECRPAVEEMLRRVLPLTTAVFVPPGGDERYATAFGFTVLDLYAHGADAIETRLRAAGLDVHTLRTGLPFDLPAEERARRGLALLHAGYLGPPNGKVAFDREATAILFDGLRRQLDASVAPGARIQWDFKDAEPWHLILGSSERPGAGGANAAAPGGANAAAPGGAGVAGPGRIADPDLTFRCSFDDWISLAADRIDPRKALLLGRVRITGRPSMLIRARRLFA
jgi:hypothetical protein